MRIRVFPLLSAIYYLKVWPLVGVQRNTTAAKSSTGCCYATLPKLEELEFSVRVKELTENNVISCDNLGLEYLPSLQRVEVDLWCNVPLRMT
jgi:hypothetical protein